MINSLSGQCSPGTACSNQGVQTSTTILSALAPKLSSVIAGTGLTYLRTGDTIFNILDDNTNEFCFWLKTTKGYDGTVITTANESTYIENVLFIKIGTEYFKRQFSGYADVKWWGAKGDGIHDDTSAIQAASNMCGALNIGLWFNGYFKVTSGLVKNGSWYFALPQYGNGGSSGLYPVNTIEANRFTVVTDGNTSRECINLTIHGGGDLDHPPLVDGYDFVGPGGINRIVNLRVFNIYGRGARFIKIYDSLVENVSVERCGIQPNANGTGGAWAFSVLEGGDTTNHTNFNRVQTELARGRAMLVEANNLCLNFTNIHSERTEVVADAASGGYTHILLGGSSTYFTARIEAVPGAPRVLLGGAGTSYDAFKCPDGQVDVHNGQNGFTMNIKNLDAGNVTCTNGGNPNISFIGLKCDGLFRVDYQKFVSVRDQSILNNVHVEGEQAALSLSDTTINGNFSSGGNNTLKATDCTLLGNFPTNSNVFLNRGVVNNSFSPSTNSIVRAYQTIFNGNVQLDTNESRFYGFGVIVNGNLTWNGGSRGYGLLDNNCRIAGSVNVKWYNKPLDSFWVKGEVLYNPNPAPGQPIAILNNRAGYGSSGQWTATMGYSIAQFVYYGNNVYQANSGGTSGTTPPTHTTGSVTDGAISWLYIGVKDDWMTINNLSPTSDISFTGTNTHTGVETFGIIKPDRIWFEPFKDLQFGNSLAANRFRWIHGGGTQEFLQLHKSTDNGTTWQVVLDINALTGVVSIQNASPAVAGLVKQIDVQADSTASDVATLKNDFNSFLAKARTATVLKP